MKAPHILSTNDYNRLSNAQQAHKEDTLTMTLGDYKLTVSIVPTGKDITVWNQTHIISVEQWYRNVYSRKHCKTIDELQQYLDCRQRK